MFRKFLLNNLSLEVKSKLNEELKRFPEEEVRKFPDIEEISKDTNTGLDNRRGAGPANHKVVLTKMYCTQSY